MGQTVKNLLYFFLQNFGLFTICSNMFKQCCKSKLTWSLLYKANWGGGGGYCHRNCPLYANGSGGMFWAGTVVPLFPFTGGRFVAVWRTTSAGCTLFECSSRFLNLLRTSRIAIIVPLLPTILSFGVSFENLKIAILMLLVFQTLSSRKYLNHKKIRGVKNT